jgi:molybdenum cofactor guanylyltransferase
VTAARAAPVGVILAGGAGLRMGGPKPTVLLRGRPLLSYPLEAVRAALGAVHVITKPDVELPPLLGVTIWIEPAEPRHPLVGVVEALALAGGREVLVCGGDLPFVTPRLIQRLAEADAVGAPAVIAAHAGAAQPLLGRYRPEAGPLLAAAARIAATPAPEAVAAIHPRLLEVEDGDELFRIDEPNDLLLASAMLAQPNVKS